MDYEKKYKEALANARQEYNTAENVERKRWLEELFPELKENADEKIKKNLITFFKEEYGTNSSAYFAGIKVKEIIAWLEKQGEQCNNEDEAILHRFTFYSYKDEPDILYLAGLYVNDEYRNKGIGTKILKIADEVAVSMKCSSILLKTEIGSNAEQLYKNNGYSVFRREEDQVWLEKQCEQEQKQVETKFKVGDWIIRNVEKSKYKYLTKYLIKEVKEHYYCEDLAGKRVLFTFNYIHKHFKLWDISDATDGDVLYDGNNACLFRKKMKDDDAVWVDAYCGIDSEGMFQVNDENECWCLACDCVPATKEQRDLLEQKMKEAGYEFEKKELKKIEKYGN